MSYEVQVNWLLESHVLGLLNGLIREIKKQGHGIKVWCKPPHFKQHWSTLFGADDCVIYYGSIGLAKEIEKVNQWTPNTYTNSKYYDCSNYYPAFGNYLLNQDYLMIPKGDVIRQKEWIYYLEGEKNEVFIRPERGGKTFTGKSISKENLEDHINSLNINDKDLCVISSPKEVYKEWRFLVVDGKIITGSQYRERKWDGKTAEYVSRDVQDNVEQNMSVHQKAYDKAEEILANTNFQCDRAWTLDICEHRGDFYMMEIGGFSCAGLYKMDLEKIVAKISEIAAEDWNGVYNIIEKGANNVVH